MNEQTNQETNERAGDGMNGWMKGVVNVTQELI